MSGCLSPNGGGDASAGVVGTSGGGGPTGTGSTEPTGGATISGGGVSTGAGGATGAESSGEASGDDFVVAPDVGGGGGIECDVWKQNCPEGKKCAAWAEGGGGAWNATRCVEVMGDRQPGEACMALGGGALGEDDCVKGAMCWHIEGEGGVGTCAALCTGAVESPVCEGDVECSFVASEVLFLCLPGCDPLVQDCPGEQMCVMINDRVACVADASGEIGGTNDSCEVANECDEGLACVDADAASSACMQGASGCCQPFCEFVEGEDGVCPNLDQVCLPWFDPKILVPPGLEDLGVCGVPG